MAFISVGLAFMAFMAFMAFISWKHALLKNLYKYKPYGRLHGLGGLGCLHSFHGFGLHGHLHEGCKTNKYIITHTMRTNWKPMNIQIAFMGLVFMAGMARVQLAKSLGKHWVLQLVELDTLQDTNTASAKNDQLKHEMIMKHWVLYMEWEALSAIHGKH